MIQEEKIKKGDAIKIVDWTFLSSRYILTNEDKNKLYIVKHKQKDGWTGKTIVEITIILVGGRERNVYVPLACLINMNNNIAKLAEKYKEVQSKQSLLAPLAGSEVKTNEL